jgi:two-component system phosphate regulon sensor histidine kinase PhoR
VRNRIFLKALASFVAVIAVATLTLDLSIRGSWERSYRERTEKTLDEHLEWLAQRVQYDHEHSLQQIAADTARISEARATIIERGGKVLADSTADASSMENHAGRPEVVRALQGGTGSSTRLSHTVGIEFLYVAMPSGDKVVRLAYPLSAIQRFETELRWVLLRSSLLALMFALLLSLAAAQLITRRLQNIVRFAEQIAAGNLGARISEGGGDEIAQVAGALDRTARRLEENFAALRDSRAQLEALLNSMNDGVIAVSQEMTVLWANRAISNITHQPVRLGAPVVEMIRHPDFLSTLHSALRSKQRETAIAPALVGRKSFSITAGPLPEGGAVSVLHDISEIETVEKIRRDFIANVSHELRTPLTSIRGYAETLIESSDDFNGSSRDFLQVIRRNAERMSRLTDDLLVLARVESGEEKLDLRPYSARELVAEAASSMQETVRTAEMQLETLETPDIPVIADSYAIHQVFANLISNAVRYAQTGKKLEIGAQEKGGTIEFFVRDYGPGIAFEHLPRIFERFYRVDKARSRETGGTGLGLAIVKHIVLNHGGSVRVESEVGHGSSFLFTLPKASIES